METLKKIIEALAGSFRVVPLARLQEVYNLLVAVGYSAATETKAARDILAGILADANAGVPRHRVKVLTTYGAATAGDVATVLATVDGHTYALQFDARKPGGHDCSGRGPDGHCYFVPARLCEDVDALPAIDLCTEQDVEEAREEARREAISDVQSNPEEYGIETGCDCDLDAAHDEGYERGQQSVTENPGDFDLIDPSTYDGYIYSDWAEVIDAACEGEDAWSADQVRDLIQAYFDGGMEEVARQYSDLGTSLFPDQATPKPLSTVATLNPHDMARAVMASAHEPVTDFRPGDRVRVVRRSAHYQGNNWYGPGTPRPYGTIGTVKDLKGWPGDGSIHWWIDGLDVVGASVNRAVWPDQLELVSRGDAPATVEPVTFQPGDRVTLLPNTSNSWPTYHAEEVGKGGTFTRMADQVAYPGCAMWRPDFYSPGDYYVKVAQLTREAPSLSSTVTLKGAM